MKMSRVGTLIIWSIGLFNLICFFYFRFFDAGWNWPILFWAVAFLGWGLQRSLGRNESPARKKSPQHPVVRFVRHTVAAIVSGAVCFFLAIFILMGLGLSHYDNYEHYGQYPVLYVTPGFVGFFLPTIVAWGIRIAKSRKNK